MVHACTSNCAKGRLVYLFILSCLSFGQRCHCQSGWVILERGLRRDLCSESNVAALYNSHCTRGPHRAVFVSTEITKRAPQTQDEWDGSLSLGFPFYLVQDLLTLGCRTNLSSVKCHNAVDGCKISNLLCGEVCLTVILPLGENDSEDCMRAAARFIHVGGGNSSADTESEISGIGVTYNKCIIIYNGYYMM